MEKKHIELIMENEQNYKQLLHLAKLREELFSPFPTGEQLNAFLKSLNDLLENYYVDPQLDKHFILHDGFEQALGMGSPDILISALKDIKQRKNKRISRT